MKRKRKFGRPYSIWLTITYPALFACLFWLLCGHLIAGVICWAIFLLGLFFGADDAIKFRDYYDRHYHDET